MPNPFRRSFYWKAGLLVPALLLCLFSFTRGIAQTTPAAPPTGIYKQLDRIDFAVSASGILTSGVSNGNYLGVGFTEKGSSTVGTLVSLRYIGKPMVGFEFNYDHSRFTEDTSNYTVCPNAACNYILGGAQTGLNELTLGYVAHPHKIFGIPTYLGAGGGTLRFKPTPYGGQGLPQQYRAAYYYEGGVEDNFPDSHFGVRAGFRQLIYLAPDFGQNYLTLTKRARTSEPTFGFFVRF